MLDFASVKPSAARGGRVVLLALVLASVCGRSWGQAVRLEWHTGLSPALAEKLAAEFGKRHRGLEVSVHPLLIADVDEHAPLWRTADVLTDWGLESRSDLAASGAFARLGAGLPPGLCPRAWDHGGYSAYTHASRISIVFLRAAVPEKDAPDSLAELAHPRWKGKVAFLAPSRYPIAVSLYRFVAAHPALGLAWLERMRDNDVLLLLTPAGVREALDSGVRPVILGRHGNYKPTGFGGVRRPREGTPLLLQATAISSRAPQPEAARLFVKWLLDPAVQRYMVENKFSLLPREDDCGNFARQTSASSETDFLRKVWKALRADDGQDSR